MLMTQGLKFWGQTLRNGGDGLWDIGDKHSWHLGAKVLLSSGHSLDDGVLGMFLMEQIGAKDS